MTLKKSNLGGAREGAGRPPLDPLDKKTIISLALPGWVLDWMRTQEESRAVVIEKALVKAHKIKRPD